MGKDDTYVAAVLMGSARVYPDSTRKMLAFRSRDGLNICMANPDGYVMSFPLERASKVVASGLIDKSDVHAGFSSVTGGKAFMDSMWTPTSPVSRSEKKRKATSDEGSSKKYKLNNTVEVKKEDDGSSSNGSGASGAAGGSKL